MADNKTLTGIFIGVAVGIATGFATEFFTFPFFHNSTLGAHVVGFANETILPIYEAAASAMDISAPTFENPNNLPIKSF